MIGPHQERPPSSPAPGSASKSRRWPPCSRSSRNARCTGRPFVTRFPRATRVAFWRKCDRDLGPADAAANEWCVVEFLQAGQHGDEVVIPRRPRCAPRPNARPAPILVVGASQLAIEKQCLRRAVRRPGTLGEVSTARVTVAGRGAPGAAVWRTRPLSPSLINRSISAHALDERLDRRVNCEQPVTRARARPRARGETGSGRLLLRRPLYPRASLAVVPRTRREQMRTRRSQR